ncbi:MAG: fumarylacetoacetate hydrolase family protein [Planctomycetaceae bacterium]|nr:fumarylacetoacetate hydrolase family protein [Planctomycetaceae bacterium]
MKIALFSSSTFGNPRSASTRSGFVPCYASTPATLVLGDERGWFLGQDLLPSGLCLGQAGDALRLIESWPIVRNQLRTDAEPIELPPSEELTWLPPVVEPNKIICIGLNYADHASETGAELPTIPVVFNKFPTTLTGHRQPIYLPPISEKVDYEAELVVVIGKEGRNIPASAAMDYVFGYTCGHDVSARDWQKGKPGGQWLLGKTFDSFAPLGPWIVTADGPTQASDLRVQFRLNGETMQDSSTGHFIFSIAFLIEHLSKFCTLRPGDLLFTGTPSGVGVARTPPVFLKAGDQAEVEIEGIGVLANPVLPG